MRGLLTILLVLALGVSSGCANPGVTVEQLHEQKPAPRTSRRHIFPPSCDELPTATYPEVPTGKRPELVSVRVDLTISRSGVPENLKASLVEEVEPAEPFLEAALATAGTIVCKPAMRRPRPGSGEIAPVPIQYRSSVVFRFYRDRKEASVSF